VPPHATRTCYDGPDGTRDVGACKHGTETCADDGSAWGVCKGETKPAAETCESTADEDCDGLDCVQWAVGASDVGITAVAIDPGSGDLVVAGVAVAATHVGSTNFDPALGSLFLGRMRSDGSGFHAWHFGAQCSGALRSLIVGQGSDLLVGGYASSSCTIGGSALPAGQFVARLDPSGTGLTWLRAIGSTPPSHLIPLDPPVPAMALTPTGDVVISSFYFGSVDFGDGPQGTLADTTSENQSGYVALLDGTSGMGSSASSGPQWAQLFSNVAVLSSAPVSLSSPSVAVDSTGMIRLAYAFTGTTNLVATDGTALSGSVSAGGTDVVVIGIDSASGDSGTVYSALQIGDASDQRVTRVAVGPDDSFIVSGVFSGSMQVPSSVGQAMEIDATLPSGEGYALAFNSSGFLKWANAFKAAATPHEAAVDSAGNTHLAAVLAGQLDWGQGSLDAAGGDMLLFADFDANGGVRWYRGYAHALDAYLTLRLATMPAGNTLVGVSAQTWPLAIGTGNLTDATSTLNAAATAFAP
jgi:hypothetical protein